MATRENAGGSLSLDNIPIQQAEDEGLQTKLKHVIFTSVTRNPLHASPVKTILLIGPTQSGKTQMVQKLSHSMGIPAIVISMASQSAENFLSTPAYMSVAEESRAQTMTQMGPPPLAQEVINLQEVVAQAAEAARTAGGDVSVLRQHITNTLQREREVRRFVSDPLLHLAKMPDESLRQLMALTEHINVDIHGLQTGWKYAPVIIFVDEANKNPELLPTLLTLSRDSRIGHHKLPHISVVYAMTEGGSNFLRYFYESEALPDFLSRVHTYRIAASLPNVLQDILQQLPAQIQEFTSQAENLRRRLAGTSLASEGAGLPFLRGNVPPANLLLRMAEAAVEARLGIGSTWTDINYETPTHWWRVLEPENLALYAHIAFEGMKEGAEEADIVRDIANIIQESLVSGHEHAPRIAQAVAKAMFSRVQLREVETFDLSDTMLIKVHTANMRENRVPPWALSESYAEEIGKAIRKFGTMNASEEEREALHDYLFELSDLLAEIKDELPKELPLGILRRLPTRELADVITFIAKDLKKEIHPDILRPMHEIVNFDTFASRKDRELSEQELQWLEGFRRARNPIEYASLYPAVEGR